MAGGATTLQQRVEAIRELCDIVLSAETKQSAGQAASPDTSLRCDSDKCAKTPNWLIFSAAICHDNESIDAAWELM
jgi:hypothetical protein